MHLQDSLGDELIHAYSRSCHIRTDERHAYSLEVALQRSVLDIGAVDNRKSDVERHRLRSAESLLRERYQAHLPAVIYDDNPLGFCQQSRNIPVACDVSDAFTDVHIVLLGQIDRDHFVLIGVHGHDSLDAGYYRNFMLDSLAAEHHRNFSLHKSSSEHAAFCSHVTFSVADPPLFNTNNYPAGRSQAVCTCVPALLSYTHNRSHPRPCRIQGTSSQGSPCSGCPRG